MNISFGKTLLAKCDLRRGNYKKVECNIFQLNSVDDKDYFERVWKSKPWQDAKYLWDMDAELRADISQRYFASSQGLLVHTLAK